MTLEALRGKRKPALVVSSAEPPKRRIELPYQRAAMSFGRVSVRTIRGLANLIADAMVHQSSLKSSAPPRWCHEDVRIPSDMRHYSRGSR
jgi:hypothetical protein